MYRKTISTAAIAAMLGLSGAAVAANQDVPEAGTSTMQQGTQQAPEIAAPTPIVPGQNDAAPDQPAAEMTDGAAPLQGTADMKDEAAPTQSSATTKEEAAAERTAALAERLVGKPVLTKDGQEVGEVVDIQTDNGRISALDVEHGGFFGFGKKQARVTADTVSLSDEGVVLHMTEEQLASMPAPKDDSQQ